MTVTFTPPSLVATDAYHHSRAASQNEAAAKFAKGQLLDALNGSSDVRAHPAEGSRRRRQVVPAARARPRRHRPAPVPARRP